MKVMICIVILSAPDLCYFSGSDFLGLYLAGYAAGEWFFRENLR